MLLDKKSFLKALLRHLKKQPSQLLKIEDPIFIAFTPTSVLRCSANYH